MIDEAEERQRRIKEERRGQERETKSVRMNEREAE